eukprot:TRINITY_DN9900_c0_g1_i2.p1 TRINITY_DN9900_c0_g1~~TRINITY_DN9900_c0_g1_i2.p1  ORF type:complete len:329 (-),score=38.36 TRINITY_DN9900_c0_g1_i2:99-1085(-)
MDEVLKAKFSRLSDTLSSERSARKPPADLTSGESLAEFKEAASVSVHSAAITSLKIALINPDLVLTGGKDCFGRLYDMERKTVVASFEHKKKVTAMGFLNNSLNSVTCSSDGTACVWEVSSDYSTKLLYTATNHKASITSCSVHPCDNYCLFFSKDGKWSLHDIARAELIQSTGTKGETPITCGEVHPDGLIVGTGLKDGRVLIWDIRAQAPSNEFKLYKGAVKRINFSEKGYHLLTVGKGEGVHLWDIRKLSGQEPALVKAEEAGGAVFDSYGVYFGVCGESIELYKVRKIAKVGEIGKGKYTDLKFGPKNSYIVAGTDSGELKIFN